MKAYEPVTLAGRIEGRILLIRGQRVMLSTHLAELYGVEPKVLVQAVKRNASRFPEDFMFQLSRGEFNNLKSQIVTSSWGGLRRATPYAFTEQGVAMLSSVLRSRRAVQVNIAIMRAFVRMRQMLASNAELARRLGELEKRYNAQFRIVFHAIRELMEPPEKARRSIGLAPSPVEGVPRRGGAAGLSDSPDAPCVRAVREAGGRGIPSREGRKST